MINLNNFETILPIRLFYSKEGDSLFNEFNDYKLLSILESTSIISLLIKNLMQLCICSFILPLCESGLNPYVVIISSILKKLIPNRLVLICK